MKKNYVSKEENICLVHVTCQKQNIFMILVSRLLQRRYLQKFNFFDLVQALKVVNVTM